MSARPYRDDRYDTRDTPGDTPHEPLRWFLWGVLAGVIEAAWLYALWRAWHWVG